MMPLIYAILKDARADLEEPSRRIDEGRRVVNDYSRMHNCNSNRKRVANEHSRMHNVHVYDEVDLQNSTPHQCTDLLKDCQKLLERFKYPWEMMPLMYAILKNARADIAEASKRIDEDKNLHHKRAYDSLAFELVNVICNVLIQKCHIISVLWEV
ncbi:unnamed protein product [Callosobruchus maculatus]|uniref:Doublesex dimerisation domain-containing protein n=1 Tax=Callosobruchus maculatus TaxID=64391 RepID=A0A653BVP9_CALMS|nr:unnamed protein product [Callosobruchus maculatus]